MKDTPKGIQDLWQIAMVFFCQQIVINLWSIFSQTDIKYTFRHFFSYDYYFIYNASKKILLGDNPYAAYDWVTPPLHGFVGPPFLAWINAPLSFVPFQLAALLFLIVSILCLYTGLRLTVLQLMGTAALLPCLVIAALYGPTYLLLERGNVDTLAMLALALAAVGTTRPKLQAIAIAVGGAIKLYPLGMLLPLFLARRLALAAAAAGGFIALMLLSGHLPQFLETLARRGELFRFDDNVSVLSLPLRLAALLSGQAVDSHYLYLPELLTSVPIRLAFGASLAFFVVTLAYGILCDGKRRRDQESAPLAIIHALLFLPFFVALPAYSIRYSLINMLLLLPVYGWIRAHKPGKADILFQLGFYLAGVQAGVLGQMIGMVGGVVAPASIILLMLWSVSVKHRLIPTNR